MSRFTSLSTVCVTFKGEPIRTSCAEGASIDLATPVPSCAVSIVTLSSWTVPVTLVP